jgi:CHAT domain-containing protein
LKPLSIAALLYLAMAPARWGEGAVANSANLNHPSPLQERLATTLSLFHEERYLEAEKQSEQLIVDALRAGDMRTATRATGNLGGLRFALHQYQAALTALLEARRMAAAIGDKSETSVLDVNVASLYMEMGDIEEASRHVERVLERLSGNDRDEHLAETQILLAQLRARQKRMPEALSLFRVGIEGAESRGDWKLAAFAWNRIGEEYLKQSDLRHAEPPLLEAYRIRVLRHLALDTSYRNLGRLRLEQGDLEGAERFLNHAVELMASPRGPIPSWDVYHYRGRLRLAQGRLAEAIADLRTAVRLAHAWRWSAPPEDAMRIGAEGWLDRVYSALIDAGNQLYQQTGDVSFIRETFEAEEENRASSLRVLVEGRIAAAQAMPASYWPAVSRLQRAEVQAARLQTPAAMQEALSARAQSSQIESSQFSELAAAPSGLLAQVRSNLGASDALLAFHLGDADSWMWAVDRDKVSLISLPCRKEIERLAAEFSNAVESASPGLPDVGATLYAALFGGLPREFEAKSRWLLELDDSLFRVPFAALPAAGSQTLAKRRAVEIVPNAALWSNRAPQRAGLFLGVGDAIYNPADPRRTRQPHPPAQSPVRLASLSALPRLAGSAAELSLCARAWSGGYELLEGPAASRADVGAAIARHPDVIHFAAHFVTKPGPNAQAAIALSLGAGGTAETLEAAEIASWQIDAGLVALSGCDSSAGAVLPGSGLLGLTRAWLAAGARAVLATHWPVSDDGGPFFAAFYRRLGQGQHPAAALRAAQVEMAAAGGWRASPRYWAAYFLMGRE